jgi:predicted dienelactone hydrolase
MLPTIVVLLGCNGEDKQLPPGFSLSAWSEPGPFRVGYREEEVVWQEPPLQAEPRTLPLAVWYPTEAETGLPVSYQGLFDAPDVLGEAPPVEDLAPLLVFSHGHQAFGQASSFLMEHFASHGWWVVAPDHTGNTTFDGADRETSIYWQRPLDLSRVIDHAEASLPLDGTVVVSGHSFGGYTAHAVGGARYAMDTLEPGCEDGSDTSSFCSTMTPEQAARFRQGFADPRIQTLISMAPGDWRLFADGLAEIDVPTLLMTGGLDPGTDGEPIWQDLAHPDDVHVDIPQGGHNVFTDLSGVIDSGDTLEPEEGFLIVRTWALAFASRYGRGDEGAMPIIDGSAEVSPACVTEFREP